MPEDKVPALQVQKFAVLVTEKQIPLRGQLGSTDSAKDIDAATAEVVAETRRFGFPVELVSTSISKTCARQDDGSYADQVTLRIQVRVDSRFLMTRGTKNRSIQASLFELGFQGDDANAPFAVKCVAAKSDPTAALCALQNDLNPLLIPPVLYVIRYSGGKETNGKRLPVPYKAYVTRVNNLDPLAGVDYQALRALLSGQPSLLITHPRLLDELCPLDQDFVGAQVVAYHVLPSSRYHLFCHRLPRHAVEKAKSFAFVVGDGTRSAVYVPWATSPRAVQQTTEEYMNRPFSHVPNADCAKGLDLDLAVSACRQERLDLFGLAAHEAIVIYPVAKTRFTCREA